MRYADGPHTQCEVHVEATTSRVWPLVTDINLPVRMSNELLGVEWLDGAAEAAMGARFLGYNRHEALGDWRTLSQVTEFDERTTFGWTVMDIDGRFGPPTQDPASPSAVWRFDLLPQTNGLLLRQYVRIGPGRSGLSLVIDRLGDEEKWVANRLAVLQASMQRTIGDIKALAEAEQ